MVLVKFKAKGKIARFPKDIEVNEDEVALCLFDYVSREAKLSESRIRLTLYDQSQPSGRAKSYVLRSTDRIGDLMKDGKLVVAVRDLGPQIAWRTVFLIEYLGPLIIHPIFYYWQRFVYGERFEHTLVQKIIFVTFLIHFVKRELETAFIHKFSLATMPLLNLFKNCFHYWMISGALVGYFVYCPVSWASSSRLGRVLYRHNALNWSPAVLTVICVAWLAAEVSNFLVHVNLASLRKKGSTERKIPYGYGFTRVSCPNYFFEAVGWFLLSLLSFNWAVALFFAVGSLQMYVWAVKKHKRYLREFPDYPANRKAMVPFVC